MLVTLLACSPFQPLGRLCIRCLLFVPCIRAFPLLFTPDVVGVTPVLTLCGLTGGEHGLYFPMLSAPKPKVRASGVAVNFGDIMNYRGQVVKDYLHQYGHFYKKIMLDTVDTFLYNASRKGVLWLVRRN